ncbi:Hsp70 family protein [Rubritalea marina]|uniref:Hsp70 family protein n=1 Tax=Rubritalea marina TaxID=361055 RepID=UPI00035EADED|nr:Hsp70 family protein [Rubritalea marina]
MASEAHDIVGIDLGTTNSVIGVVESGFPILLADANGSRITPSAIHYDGDDVVVGADALRQRGISRQVVTSVKRFMGKRYSEVADEDSHLKVEQAADGGILILGRKPEEHSAEIIATLKRLAEAQLGREVKQAVITVPAYFNDAQRQATKLAGELAGLEVMRIVSEPTAAALAYGLDKLGDSSKVAVYDFGGGTFDVSVLEMRDGVFQVLATDGDTQLGGDDIDHALAQWIWQQAGDASELQAYELDRLQGEARKVKESLSKEETHSLQIPFFRENLHLELAVTQEQFERVVAGVIQRTESHCRRVLNDAGVESVDLDAVVLVGGSTRIPAVRRLVERVFGMKPDLSQHPDEAVALGAVIQGGVLSGALRDIVLLDVTPLSLGIETFGGLMNVLIPRNTTIPCKAGEMFTNAVANQKEMCVRVLQGEREMARDNWELGQVNVLFEPARKGQARVGVQFAIDENGILEVLARDTQTGKDTLLQIDSAAVDVDDQAVEDMVSESVDYAFDDMAERVFTEAKLKAEELLPAVDVAMQQLQEELSEQDVVEIHASVEEVRQAMVAGEANRLKAAVQVLDKATEQMAAILVEKAMEAALMQSLEEN